MFYQYVAFNIIMIICNLMIDYGRIYKDITSLDPKIRLVTICDHNGITMYSNHREGVKNLLSPEESKKSLVLAINAWKIRNELASKIGKEIYLFYFFDPCSIKKEYSYGKNKVNE